MQSSAFSSIHFYENSVLILQLSLILRGAQHMISEVLPLEQSLLPKQQG